MRKVATPWARAGSGFTLLFEAYVLALAKTMPIANATERLSEHDTRLWRIVEHYVWRAVEKLDLSRLRRIAADETSARRGHDYISLFVDMAERGGATGLDRRHRSTGRGSHDRRWPCATPPHERERRRRPPDCDPGAAPCSARQAGGDCFVRLRLSRSSGLSTSRIVLTATRV